MPSQTDVINAALTLIGADPITSIDDVTNEANKAALIYDVLLEDLLRSHDWDFATTRAKLNQMSMVPEFEFDNAFALPDKWVKTIAVHDNDAGTGNFVYRQEVVDNKKAIVTSSSDVWMRYVYLEEDPSKWTADFRRAMIEALARDLAVPLAQSNTMQDTYEKQQSRTKGRARSTDAMGSFPDQRPRGSWANSRGGRRSEWPFIR